MGADVTPFFIPPHQGQAGEDRYQLLRLHAQGCMGRAPTGRRIVELWTRRGNLDCITRVGAPDPICGDVVSAIFDMGPHQPFVVYCQEPIDTRDPAFEVLGCNAYSVSEFSR